MQKWEYKLIIRGRGFNKPANKNSAYLEGTEWHVDMLQILPGLGAEGWELVTVTPLSSVLGGWDREDRTQGFAYSDYAGFTSEQLWVFKRPKP